jgi:hypothetical protein
MKALASQARRPQISTYNVIFNVFSCVAACAGLCYIRTRLQFFPCTLYGLCQLGLAEINRRKGRWRLTRAELHHKEKARNDGNISDNWAVASVVGYREELVLWKRTLKSYLHSVNIKTILLGIDGNGDEDLEMVDTVIEVRSIYQHAILKPWKLTTQGLRCDDYRYSPYRSIRTNSRAPGRGVSDQTTASEEER